MKSALIVLGGCRIGDQFHQIPILNRVKSMGFDKIKWITGSYASAPAKMLAEIYGIDLEIYDDGWPTDIHSRKKFLDAVQSSMDFSKYDYVYSNYKGTAEFEPDLNFTQEETYLPVITTMPMPPEMEPNKYIMVQASSISKDKMIEGMFHVSYPLKTVGIGGKSERRIPGSINMMGFPWPQVLSAIQNAAFMVGIHSAATCLALHTRTPLLVCDLGKNFDFSKQGHPNIVQLYDRPGRDEIQEKVDEFYERYVNNSV